MRQTDQGESKHMVSKVLDLLLTQAFFYLDVNMT